MCGFQRVQPNQPVYPQVVLDKGFHELMAGNRIADLRRMYQLFCRVSKQLALRGALGSYIKKAGQVCFSLA